MVILFQSSLKSIREHPTYVSKVDTSTCKVGKIKIPAGIFPLELSAMGTGIGIGAPYNVPNHAAEKSFRKPACNKWIDWLVTETNKTL